MRARVNASVHNKTNTSKYQLREREKRRLVLQYHSLHFRSSDELLALCCVKTASNTISDEKLPILCKCTYKLSNLGLDRGKVLFPRRHRLFERDDLSDPVDHLLHQLDLGEPDALFVGDVEFVFHRRGVLAGGAPWLQVEFIAYL